MLNNNNDLISIKKNSFLKAKRSPLWKKWNQYDKQMVFLSIFINEMKIDLTETWAFENSFQNHNQQAWKHTNNQQA